MAEEFQVVDRSIRSLTNEQQVRASISRRGEVLQIPWVMQLVLDGRVFVASDADENDVVTGATSFAATTPTLLLDVPVGTTAIPLWIILNQAGTVAGGNITAGVSIDRVERYSSGGTEEAILGYRTDEPQTPTCKLYSGATAAAATDARLIWGNNIVHDIDGLFGAGIELLAFVNFLPPALVGDAALLVNTSAGTTGPSWFWSVGWAEIPTTNIKAT